MAATTELSVLHRRVAELRESVLAIHERYGDVPAVRRLLGDIDRLDLDAADLDDLEPPPAFVPPPVGVHLIDDTPPDPSLWVGADDEGLGGYQR